MSARTDALVSQQETGKITASIVPRCGRLPPGMSCRFNANSAIMFPVETDFLGVAEDIELTTVVAAAACSRQPAIIPGLNGRSAIGRQR